MTSATNDPLAGLIADAREIPAMFQPRRRTAPGAPAPDAQPNSPVPEQGTFEPVRVAAGH